MASYREQQPTERFEKRKLTRFPVQLPVELGHKNDLSSICTNLSSEGVSIETSRGLYVGERLSVRVIIAPKEEPLRMLGQVVWKREAGILDPDSKPVSEVGIRFIRPLPSPWKMQEEPDFAPESSGEDAQVIPFRRL